MKIGVCCIAKNEADLDEWIQWYIDLGFDEIIIYDNESSNPVQSTHQCVTVRHIGGSVKQLFSYNDCITRDGGKVDWLAFFDADEFLELKGTVKQFLNKMGQNVGAVGVNWLMFGSSGHYTKPVGGIVNNFRFHESSMNPHVKSIVRPQAVKYMNVHSPKLKKGFTFVNGFGNKIAINIAFNVEECSGSNRMMDVIRLNHYYYRSVIEWVQKCERGRADNGEKRCHNEGGAFIDPSWYAKYNVPRVPL